MIYFVQRRYDFVTTRPVQLGKASKETQKETTTRIKNVRVSIFDRNAYSCCRFCYCQSGWRRGNSKFVQAKLTPWNRCRAKGNSALVLKYRNCYVLEYILYKWKLERIGFTSVALCHNFISFARIWQRFFPPSFCVDFSFFSAVTRYVRTFSPQAEIRG